MGNTIIATFDARRDAEMAVERLVQEFGLERTDIFVVAQGDENSAGIEPAGSDSANAATRSEGRDDGAYEGAVTVSVDIEDQQLFERVRTAFDEFGGTARALS